MKDLKRISIVAIVLLVAMRIAIGWQFLYEGLWKYSTLDGPNPWSAEGYLKQSQGPFRDTFVSLAGGDPYDLDWLDYEHVSKEWTDYVDRFKDHYDLTDDQLQQLATIENGPPHFTAELDDLPRVFETQGTAKRKWDSLSETIWYDEDANQLVVSGTQPMTPREAADLQALVDVVKTDDGQYVMKGEDGGPVILAPDGERLMLDEHGVPARLDENGLPDPDQEVADWHYQPADDVERRFFIRLDNLLTDEARYLGYRQRLAALLRGDPELAGVWWNYDEQTNRGEVTMAEGDWTPEEGPLLMYGKIQEYKHTVAQYEEAIENAERTGLAHYYEHADRLKTKFQSVKTEVVAPVLALDAEFREKVFDMLTVDQLQSEPLPPEDTPAYRASMQAMWGMLILGPLLILGLFSRLAAFFGAVMVLSFYLVIPPWPGVPPELQAPEHALFVNKNLIEAIALLGLAALPSGTWFGLDGLIARGWRAITSRRKDTPPASPMTTGSPPVSTAKSPATEAVTSSSPPAGKK